MRKKILATILTASMVLGMAMPAFATTTPVTGSGGSTTVKEGTQVWAGVVVDQMITNLNVTVPTLFAFVVNGSTADTNAITVANGSLYLPNYKVVDYNGTGDSAKIAVEGAEVAYDEDGSDLTIINNSTRGNTNPATTATLYTGLPVEIKGSITNEIAEAARNSWTHIDSAPTTADTDAHKYRLSIGGKPFDNAESIDGVTVFSMKEAIMLNEPDLAVAGVAASTDGNITEVDESGFAKNGKQNLVKFNVEVGGERADYTTIENSVQVGTIVWSIAATSTTP